MYRLKALLVNESPCALVTSRKLEVVASGATVESEQKLARS